jgi:hypothetical protein
MQIELGNQFLIKEFVVVIVQKLRVFVLGFGFCQRGFRFPKAYFEHLRIQLHKGLALPHHIVKIDQHLLHRAGKLGKNVYRTYSLELAGTRHRFLNGTPANRRGFVFHRRLPPSPSPKKKPAPGREKNNENKNFFTPAGHTHPIFFSSTRPPALRQTKAGYPLKFPNAPARPHVLTEYRNFRASFQKNHRAFSEKFKYNAAIFRQFSIWAHFLRQSRKKPGFSGLRYRSGHSLRLWRASRPLQSLARKTIFRTTPSPHS